MKKKAAITKQSRPGVKVNRAPKPITKPSSGPGVSRDNFQSVLQAARKEVKEKLASIKKTKAREDENFIPEKRWDDKGRGKKHGCCSPLVDSLKDGNIDRSKWHKPKKPRDQKLAEIIATMKRKDSILPQLFHLLERYFYKQKPGNAFETGIFARLDRFPKKQLAALEKGVDVFKNIDGKNRSAVFHPSFLDWSIDEPVDPGILQLEMLDEGMAFLGIKGLDNILRAGFPRPWFGQPTGDPQPPAPFPWINEVNLSVEEPNPLRTATHYKPIPFYKPEEYQQTCDWKVVEDTGQTEATCQRTQTPFCDAPGHIDYNSVANGGLNYACLRVREVRAGGSVTLVGFNYFSRNSQVILTKLDDGSSYQLDGFVIGDTSTPILDSAGKVISDHHVRDMLCFDVPEMEPLEELIEFPPGVYQVVVKVPNDISFTLPDGSQPPEFLSNIAYLKVLPKADLKYRIWSDQAHCYEDTKGEAGTDEIYARAYTAVFDPNAGAPQIAAPTGVGFSGSEDGDTENFVWDMLGTLGNPETVNGLLAIGIIGWEVDAEQALEDELFSWDEAFTRYWNIIWQGLVGAVAGAGAIIAALLAFLAKAVWWIALIVVVVAIAIALLVGVFWAIWAPPDKIIQDLIVHSELSLYYLTHPRSPVPGPSSHYTVPAIEVQVLPEIAGKIATLFTEERQYNCPDESSLYGFRVLYQRDV